MKYEWLWTETVDLSQMFPPKVKFMYTEYHTTWNDRTSLVLFYLFIF